MADTTEIPADIMEAARRIASEISEPPVHGSPSLAFPIIARALHVERLAERRSCAKVVDLHAAAKETSQ